MNSHEIEYQARRLLGEVMGNQSQLFDELPSNPLQYFSPEIACKHLGLSYEMQPEIDSRFTPGSAVAGLLDRRQKLVVISQQFPNEVQRFTAAHEVGHYVLHDLDRPHRDRPLSTISRFRDTRAPIEQEADHFAACWLMPRKILTAYFAERFGPTPVEWSDAMAFHCGVDEATPATRTLVDDYRREVGLATCRSLGGPHFDSLTEIFDVSPIAMAIRIRELKLLKAWP